MSSAFDALAYDFASYRALLIAGVTRTMIATFERVGCVGPAPFWPIDCRKAEFQGAGSSEPSRL